MIKPLLRALILVNAVITLAFGLLFIATPWNALFDALDLIAPSPAMVGQLFGLSLLGMAWLQGHAAVSGALTVPVARAVGHVDWLSGVIMLVWLIAVRSPRLSGLGQLIGPLVAVVLVLLGLALVRLASTVRKRERLLAAGAMSAARAEREAARERGRAGAAGASTAGTSPPVTSSTASGTVPPSRVEPTGGAYPANPGVAPVVDRPVDRSRDIRDL